MQQLVNNNPYSHLTAKDRARISLPARILLERNLLHGDVLDFGCGLGRDVQSLKANGIAVTAYDPYYAPGFPLQKFDTILCSYVLNVLLPEEQADVLMDVSYLLKPGGKAYFTVSRGLQYEGFRSHKVQRLPTYQCNVRLPYPTLFRNDKCEVYEYWHYSWLHRGNAAISPFFEGEELRDLIVETDHAFALYLDRPITQGHALIIPKRRTPDYFDLSLQEQNACWIMLNRVQRLLTQRYQPNGFSVRIETSAENGHAHIALMPQYRSNGEAPLFLP